MIIDENTILLDVHFSVTMVTVLVVLSLLLSQKGYTKLFSFISITFILLFWASVIMGYDALNTTSARDKQISEVCLLIGVFSVLYIGFRINVFWQEKRMALLVAVILSLIISGIYITPLLLWDGTNIAGYRSARQYSFFLTTVAISISYLVLFSWFFNYVELFEIPSKRASDKYDIDSTIDPFEQE